jgi:lipid-A-disaccharide synthase
MRIFISAGEPSGDLHAANLVRAIRRRVPDAEFVGFGGPKLEAAGAKLIYPLVELAVMWFGRVLLNLHKFIRLANQAEACFRDEKPDVVILIDYPGFHWVLAKRAKRWGVPVVYFVPPQLWAWAGWRVKKVRKWIDHLLCSLPFEPEWYRARGVANAVHVGHPYFDELAERELDEGFLQVERGKGGPVVAILPGSRTQEVTKNLPLMLRAASLVAQSNPGTRFVVACFKETHRHLAMRMLVDGAIDIPNLEFHQGRTPELIRLADVAWAVSGSVGLELLVEALPTVVLYKVNRIDLIIARPFIKTKYISLVNLLADDMVMPEYLTDRDVSPELARWASRWLNDPAERAAASARLAELRDKVAVPGATERAADRIAAILQGAESPYRGPHGPASGHVAVTGKPSARDNHGSH